ncbi:hypothetical protein KC316_g46 [Hortaea werneckii]|nr:hypothetical protein KC316_g46 [Hortaea werneckii]
MLGVRLLLLVASRLSFFERLGQRVNGCLNITLQLPDCNFSSLSADTLGILRTCCQTSCEICQFALRSITRFLCRVLSTFQLRPGVIKLSLKLLFSVGEFVLMLRPHLVKFLLVSSMSFFESLARLRRLDIEPLGLLPQLFGFRMLLCYRALVAGAQIDKLLLVRFSHVLNLLRVN